MFLLLGCAFVYPRQLLSTVFFFAAGCDINEKEIDFNDCEAACEGKWILSSFVFCQCNTQTADRELQTADCYPGVTKGTARDD